MSLLSRLQNLFRGRRLGGDLDEEIAFHLEARKEDNMNAGMTPDEAGYDAARRFGNRALAREDARQTDVVAGLETVAQDARYALRGLGRSPGFTLIAIFALMLGIGANTAVFTLVNGVLLRPLPFPEPDRLFLIAYEPSHAIFGIVYGLADRDFLQFQRQTKAFEHIATYQKRSVNLTGTGDPVSVPSMRVTSDFLTVLRVNPAIGRGFAADEFRTGADDVALIGDKLWRGRFGANRNVLGQTIQLDGVPHKIIGVMPPGFGLSGNAELWTPFTVRLDPHNGWLGTVVGRLRTGWTRQQAQLELEAFARQTHPAPREKNLVVSIFPLTELFVGKVRASMLVFAGAVAFVLLIACANFSNLLLIRAASRQQEVALRTALGASRWRIVRQLLTESTIVSLAGGAAGLVFAKFAVPALLALAPPDRIPRSGEIHIDGWVLLFTAGVSLLTGTVFGLVPAFHATRRELRDVLSLSSRSATRRFHALRGALVISEIALSLILLTGAGLMLRSFARMRAVDPGFKPDNILTMTVDLPPSAYRSAPTARAFHARALAKLATLPGVTAAGAVNWLPFNGDLVVGDFQLEGGRKLPRNFLVDKPAVSPGYFRAMGVRLLSGRDFTEHDDDGAPRVVIVSQLVARRLWPGENVLGKRISMADKPKPTDWLTIVGVVEDVRQSDLRKDPSPATYQPYTQVTSSFFLAHMTFVVRTAGPPENLAPALRGALHEVDKNQPVQTISMADLLAANTAEPQFQSTLLTAFGSLALILAAIGLYGVLSYSVAERTREVGIRMALGAERTDIIRLVFRQTLLFTAAGIIVGGAAAIALTRVIAGFLFDIKPTDPVTFASVACLLALVAMAAGIVPVLRAARVDPVVALRHE